MDRVFLDACVLFSAAHNPTSPLRHLWEQMNVTLLSSSYAVEEARRNLGKFRPERLRDLEFLIGNLEMIEANPLMPLPEESEGIAEKDLPILLAAITAESTHLLTVDKKHFGRFFGKEVAGVEIVSPSMYFPRFWSA